MNFYFGVNNSFNYLQEYVHKIPLRSLIFSGGKIQFGVVHNKLWAYLLLFDLSCHKCHGPLKPPTPRGWLSDGVIQRKGVYK